MKHTHPNTADLRRVRLWFVRYFVFFAFWARSLARLPSPSLSLYLSHAHTIHYSELKIYALWYVSSSDSMNARVSFFFFFFVILNFTFSFSFPCVAGHFEIDLIQLQNVLWAKKRNACCICHYNNWQPFGVAQCSWGSPFRCINSLKSIFFFSFHSMLINFARKWLLAFRVLWFQFLGHPVFNSIQANKCQNDGASEFNFTIFTHITRYLQVLSS